MSKPSIFLLIFLLLLSTAHAKITIISPGPEYYSSKVGKVIIPLRFSNTGKNTEEVTWSWQWKNYRMKILAQVKKQSITLEPGSSKKITLSLPLGQARRYRVYVNWKDSKESGQFITEFYTDQAVGMRKYYLLDGAWQRAAIEGGFPCSDKDRAKIPKIPTKLNWKNINIPKGQGIKKGKIFFYRTTFSVPKWFRGDKYQLHFRGIGKRAHVWINNKYLGYIEGAWTTHLMAVKDSLKLKGDNILMVALTDASNQLQDPKKGTNYNWPIGHNGNGFNGIYDHVWLTAVPAVRISSWQWTFNYKERMLKLKVNAVNNSSKDFSGNLSVCLLDAGAPTPFTRKISVSIPARKNTQIKLQVSVKEAKLWWPNMPDAPGNPFLYGIMLKLSKNGRAVDELLDRVGLREFSIENGRYVLNGKVVNLWAGGMGGWTAPWKSAKARSATLSDKGIISRIHCNPVSKNVIEIADEAGHLIQIESAFTASGHKYPLDDNEFWQNLNTHLRQIIEEYRNSPSVVSYSLSNEVFLCGAEKFKNGLDNMSEVWKMAVKLDPSRPSVINGDGDLRGRIGTINLHYPRHLSRHITIPQDAFWLKRGKLNQLELYPGTIFWDKNKVLEIGEDQWDGFSAIPGGCSILMGDSVFADKTKVQKGHDELAKIYMIGYRDSGVSYYQPWSPTSSKARAYAFQSIAAFLIDYMRTYCPSVNISWKINVHNDSLADHKFKLGWKVDGKKYFTDDVNVAAGGKKREKINFPAPKLPGDYSVKISLTDENGKIRFSEKHLLRIRKTTTISVPASLPVYLFCKNANSIAALQKTGITGKRLSNWSQLVTLRAGLLIIGPETVSPKLTGRSGKLIEDFARKGGKVLFLQQNSYPSAPVSPVNLRQTAERKTTVTFIGMPGHPVLNDLTDEDFRFWNSDHIVAQNEFFRPTGNGAVALLESGGRQGTAWTPLVYVPYGKGWYIFSQLELLKKITKVPAISKLLSNIVKFAATRQKTTRKKLYIIGSNALIEKNLKKIGLDLVKLESNTKVAGLKHNWLLVLPGEVDEKQGKAILNYVKKGGKVWLMSWSGKGFEQISRHLKLSPFEKVGYGYQLLINSPNGLLGPMNNCDLFWGDSGLGGAKEIIPISRYKLNPTGIGKLISLKQMTSKSGKKLSLTGWSAPKRFRTTCEMKNSPVISWKVPKESAGKCYLGMYVRISNKAPKPRKQLNSAYLLPAFGWQLENCYKLSVNGKKIPVVKDPRSVKVTIRAKGWAMPYGTLISKVPIELKVGDVVSIEAVKKGNLWAAGLELRAPRDFYDITPLTSPAVLAIAKYGKGKILIDGINWNGGFSKLNIKARQAFNHLCYALGIKFKSQLKNSFNVGFAALQMNATSAKPTAPAKQKTPHFDGTANFHGDFELVLNLKNKGQGGIWTIPAGLKPDKYLLQIVVRVSNKSLKSWDIAPCYSFTINGQKVAVRQLKSTARATFMAGNNKWGIIYGVLQSTVPLKIKPGDKIGVEITRNCTAFVAALRLVMPQTATQSTRLLNSTNTNTKLKKPVNLAFSSDKEQIKSALILSKQKISAKITVNARVSSLELIHSFYHPWTDFAGQSTGCPVAVYQVNYSDGSIAKFSVGYKEHVATPLDKVGALPEARKVWEGKSPFMTALDSLSGRTGEWIQKEYKMPAYAMDWHNPHPQKIIKDIEVKLSNKGGIFIIYQIISKTQ